MELLFSWMSEDILNKRNKLSEEQIIEEGYRPLCFLSDKYGYAKDHIGRLARTGRIQAIRYGNRGQWYAKEDDIRDYKTNRDKRFLEPEFIADKISNTDVNALNNYAPILRTEIDNNLDMSGQNPPILLLNQNDLGEIGTVLSSQREDSKSVRLISEPADLESLNSEKTVLSLPHQSEYQFREGWDNTESSLSTKTHTKKINAVLIASVLLGGVLIFTYFVPSNFMGVRTPFAYLKTVWQKMFSPNTSDNIYVTIIDQGEPKTTGTPAITSTPIQSASPTPLFSSNQPSSGGVTQSFTKLTKELTITKDLTPSQLNAIYSQLATTDARIDSLLSRINSISTNVAGIPQAPSFNPFPQIMPNDPGIRPTITINPDDITTKTLTVTQTATINSLTVSAGMNVADAVSAGKYSGGGLADCDTSTNNALQWNQTTGLFSCATVSGGGSGTLEITNNAGSTYTHYGSMSFDANMFDITAGINASESYVRLDWTNGPASRSMEQAITSQWEFRNGASFSADLEVYDNTGSAFAIFSSTSLGRFGLGDTTPEAFFEIASSSGIVASISNIFSINATTTSSSFTGSLNISKGLTANSYQGGGLVNCTASEKITYANGQFSCGTDIDTDTNTIFNGVLTGDSAQTSSHIDTLTFDGGHFTVTNAASTSYVRLDWTNGPASRSMEQAITSQWEFRNGASFSADLEVYDNTGSAFAIFSSTSLGRFGLGDTTPEAFFEIASSSGIVASISNIFSINATDNLISINSNASLSGAFEITRNGTIGNHLKLTDSSISPETMNYFTLSVNDGDFQIRHASKSDARFSEELTTFSISSKSLATTIGTPASPSLRGNYSVGVSYNNIFISQKYAYLSGGTSGIHIVDISNPSSPSFKSSYNTSGNALDLFVSGKYLYVADFTNLHTIDISNPASPRLSNILTTTGSTRGIYISGQYAYVAEDPIGLQIINISNPSH